jgi:outer membrane protein TolC
VAIALAALALEGCATYRPQPLPASPALANAAAAPDARWSVEDVVALALRDSPDLIAVRVQHGVALAQRRQDGLLPDPSFSGAILPLVAGPGSTLAWNASLTEDIRAIVTLKARRAGAKAAALQVDAQILWAEWRTAAQARLLATQLIEGERALAIQRQAAQLLSDRQARLARALASGDESLGVTAPDLAAFQTARAQAEATVRDQQSRRHQLNALLGREPDADLPLSDALDTAQPDLGSVDAMAAGLVQRRPDLIALRLGYQAQEARTRLAVLDQFPAFSLGPTGGSDNSNVRNAGPQIGTSLPIFDGGRGDVGLQRATRAQLRAEYQARLDTAYGELRGAVAELRADQAALDAVRADLPAALRAMEQARRALDAGALDDLAYADLAVAYFNKAGEAQVLEQTVQEQALAIDAITGAGLPSISSLPDDAQ